LSLFELFVDNFVYSWFAVRWLLNSTTLRYSLLILVLYAVSFLGKKPKTQKRV